MLYSDMPGHARLCPIFAEPGMSYARLLPKNAEPGVSVYCGILPVLRFPDLRLLAERALFLNNVSFQICECNKGYKF